MGYGNGNTRESKEGDKLWEESPDEKKKVSIRIGRRGEGADPCYR